MHRDDWEGTMADAARVTKDFRFEPPSTPPQSDQGDGFFYFKANEPCQSHWVVGTFCEG